MRVELEIRRALFRIIIKTKKKIGMIIRVSVSPPINKTIWNAQLCMQFVCWSSQSHSQCDNSCVCLLAFVQYEGGISQVLLLFLEFNIRSLTSLHWWILVSIARIQQKIQAPNIAINKPEFPSATCDSLNWCDAENMLVIIWCMCVCCVRGEITTACGPQYKNSCIIIHNVCPWPINRIFTQHLSLCVNIVPVIEYPNWKTIRGKPIDKRGVKHWFPLNSHFSYLAGQCNHFDTSITRKWKWMRIFPNLFSFRGKDFLMKMWEFKWILIFNASNFLIFMCHLFVLGIWNMTLNHPAVHVSNPQF